MIKTIKAKDLNIGMYINLPHAWRAHPFLRNSFTITSKEQIIKIINFGITEVNIDMHKGIAAADIVKEVIQPEKNFSKEAGHCFGTIKRSHRDKKCPQKQKHRLSIGIP